MKKKTSTGKSRSGISHQFYLVHFNKNELNNLKSLEKARAMFNVLVTWEHFRKPGDYLHNITQCRKCQRFGHGTKNCHMDAKCMICGASSHAKDTCPAREDSKNFKCSNCGGNHKSNFWDCPSRKKVVEFRDRQKKTTIHRSSHSAGGALPHSQNFARPMGSTHQRTSFVSQNGTNQPNIPNFVGTHNASYANVAAGRHNNTSFNESPNNQRTQTNPGMSASDFNFLSEQLQLMITALFQAKTQVEAVQLGVKYTTEIVIGLRFNGSK